MERYNLTVAREGKNGKTYWDQVGVMFKREKGGYSIMLSMFPNLNIMAFPPKDDDGRRGQDTPPPPSADDDPGF